MSKYTAFDLHKGLADKNPDLLPAHKKQHEDQISRSFAFRNPSRPVALRSPATLRRAQTGLWSAEMDHPSGKVTSMGHLSKSEAKASMNEKALRLYGRVPIWHDADHALHGDSED